MRPGNATSARRLARAGVSGILLLALKTVLPEGALAQRPSPLDQSQWVFPGGLSSPAGARSAALALSDRWLGSDPFHNPAVGAGGFEASGQLYRSNRQDLRTNARNFDEQPFFIDGAGAWFGVPVQSVVVAAYGYQPVLHLEDNAYSSGAIGSPDPPATLQTSTSVRELRAGLAVARNLGSPLFEAAVAGEWIRRSDSYEVLETSGSPNAGTRRVAFSGSGVGFSAGVRWGAADLLRLPPGSEAPDEIDSGYGIEIEEAEPVPALPDSARPRLPAKLSGRLTIGAALRFVPSLSLAADQSLILTSGDSVATFDGKRQSGWEGGVSAAYRLSPAFTLSIGAGGGTARDWEGFGASAGRSFGWGVGGSFRDPRDPWIARLGFGEEQQDGVSESRASALSFGLGWQVGGGVLEVGVLHRSVEHGSRPRAYENRLFLTYAGR